MGDAFNTLCGMELLKWNYKCSFPKIETFESKGPIPGYKEWSDWSSAPVGDIPWYEYKCLLCTICGGNDEN